MIGCILCFQQKREFFLNLQFLPFLVFADHFQILKKFANSCRNQEYRLTMSRTSKYDEGVVDITTNSFRGTSKEELYAKMSRASVLWMQSKGKNKRKRASMTVGGESHLVKLIAPKVWKEIIFRETKSTDQKQSKKFWKCVEDQKVGRVYFSYVEH